MTSKKTSSKDKPVSLPNEESFRWLFANHPAPMWVYDLKTLAFLEVNEAALEKYGYSRAEFLKMTLKDIRPAEDVSRLLEDIKKNRPALQHSGEWRHKLKDGRIIDVEINSHTIEFNGRKAALITAQDVTERKRAEDELRALSTRQEAFLAAVPDILTEVDRDKVYTWVNPAGVEFFGEDVIGQKAAFYFEGEQDTYNQVKPLLNGSENVIYIESWQRRKDGEKRLLAWWCRVLKDTDGNVVGAFSSAHDITERKRVEESLRESEENYRRLFENTSLGIFQSTPEEKAISVNLAFARMFGYDSPADALKSIKNVATDVFADPNRRAEIIRLMAENPGLRTFENLYRRKDGSTFIGSLNSMPIMDANGSLIRIEGMIEDITERKRAEEAQQQNELLFRTLFELSPDAVVLIDPHDPNVSWLIVDCNAAACLMNGYRRDELIGHSIDIVNVTSATQAERNIYMKQLREVGNLKLETFHRHKNGTAFPVEVSTTLIKIGERELVLGIDRDITERKRAEGKLRESEERYRRLAENASDIVCRFEFGPPYRVAYINSAVTAISGYAPAEFYADPDLVGKLAHPDDLKNLEKIGVEGAGFYGLLSLRFIRKDGQVIWLEMRNIPVQDANGQIIALESIARDITERKRTEDVLRENEERFKAIANYAVSWESWFGPDGKYIWVNPSVEHFTGYSAQEILAMTDFISTVIAGEDRPTFIQRFQEAIHGSREENFEFRYLHKNGDKRWLSASWQPIYDAQGNPLGTRSSGYDITARKQAEEALRESEEKFKTLFNSANDAIFTMNHTVFLDCNATTEKIFRCLKDQIIGHSPLNFSPERQPDGSLSSISAIEKIEAAFAGEPQSFEWLHTHLDGTPFDAEVSLNRVFIGGGFILQAIVRDVTERKQAEDSLKAYNTRLETAVEARTRELRETQEQLIRQEKLAVLGQLAGGVGHELRNPLAVINNAVYYLKLVQPDADDKVKSYLAMIERETRNAEKIISDLLDFARVKSADREAVSVSELVQRVLARFPAPESVEVTLDFPPGLPQVFADPRQIEQVLGNLVVNACQAMPKGGQLLVLSRVEGSVNSENWIRIAVRDTGMGIPPENMKKLFEPLFTTKPKGIGLGLAVSRKLAEANGGRIEVQSEAGVRSTITLH